MKIPVLYSFYIAPEILWKLPNALEILVCYNEERNFGILKRKKMLSNGALLGQMPCFEREVENLKGPFWKLFFYFVLFWNVI